MKIKLIVVATLLSVGFANAEPPSIPQTHHHRKPPVRHHQPSPNVVWGTEYDYLSTRYIRYEDIMNYDRGQIRVLRNSIYARHGRIFKDKNLSAYFNSQPWYRGWRNEIPQRELNKFEKANIDFLQKHE